MTSRPARRLTLYLNVGHALDHLVMLIYPTVVLALAAAWNRPYAELLPLSLGGFIAFGAFSLPAGWLADHWSRFGMMVVFFLGVGAASILTGLAQSEWQIAAGLTLVGLFAAIYHPVGIAMLVAEAPKVGRTLGVNGVFGNVGVAFAALLAGALADLATWRAAFIVPGIAAIALGLGFFLAGRGVDPERGKAKGPAIRLPRELLVRVFLVIAVTTAAGGLIFNATTVSMPKLFQERLAAITDTTFGIGALVSIVYLIAAMAQLLVGWLIDRHSLKAVFVTVALAQVPLLAAAGTSEGTAMMVVAVAMMFFVFGQIPINDAMIARYTAEEWRARAYSVRYVVSFMGSALAVPLVAAVSAAYGALGPVYPVLAVFAALILAAALALPGDRAIAARGRASVVA
ncbi:MAG: MFS transporter [Burkholderiales bacterium]|nr:MFS transporter [Burkholderiales bacterium]